MSELLPLGRWFVPAKNRSHSWDEEEKDEFQMFEFENALVSSVHSMHNHIQVVYLDLMTIPLSFQERLYFSKFQFGVRFDSNILLLKILLL